MAHAQLAHQSSQDTIAQFARYVIPNYRRFPVCLVRGEGSWVWDAEGHRYLDFFPGWGCNLLGHCPPRVVDAVRDQIGQLIHVPNTWYMEPQGAFAQALSERSIGSHLHPGQCFFCNSGAEANEAAIKLARAHGHAHGRYKIVTMEGGFHGRTFAALTATAQPKYHVGFEPMVPGFVYVPYNDLEAVARVLDHETAAVLVEPIQGEGGVNIPGPEYLPGLRRLCDERGVLLILDEVQTGMGRTGHWFAYQQFGAAAEPDILTCAKALAGGIAAGVMIARAAGGRGAQAGYARVHLRRQPDRLPGRNGHDRGDREGRPARARVGDRRAVPEPVRGARRELPEQIREVRVRGVMVGLNLTFDASDVVSECLKRLLLINATHGRVVRLLPALTISDELIDQGCAILADVLREVVV